jgi:tripartite-type tricarboxylate transporter receptor subunit TctC
MRVKFAEGTTLALARRLFLRLAASALAGPALLQRAWAQGYPTRPVKLLVATAPGGTADLLARLACQWLTERTGQSFVVENRTGAAGALALEAAVRASSDGYTLHFAGPVNAINPTLYDKAPYLDEIAPVAALARMPHVIEVHPDSPIKSVPELIAYAKANPGKLSYGSAGIGTSNHVAVELFKMMGDVNMLHVPYRGTNPAIMDLFGGSIQVVFDILPSSMEYIKSGKLRALAVTGPARMEALPNVPAALDFVPGYEASAWFGFGAPKGTPPEIIDRINKAINAAFDDAKFKARLGDLGCLPMPGSPNDFRTFIAEEVQKWAKVIRFAGIKPNQ